MSEVHTYLGQLILLSIVEKDKIIEKLIDFIIAVKKITLIFA